MSKLVERKNKPTGCDMAFKFPMQMYRHLENCKFPPGHESKMYEPAEDKFKCKQCGKIFAHQPSVIRHLKKCSVEYSVNSCMSKRV